MTGRVGVITGGSFEGERLRGKILSGGSDWQSLRRSAAAGRPISHVDARRR
jgi:hypothetical protein